MNPLGKYSKEVQNIINVALNEQRIRKSPHLSTEHILLAVLKQENNIITKFFNHYNINYKNFSEKIDEVLGRGTKIQEEKIMTPLLKRIISNGIIEANENGFKELTTYYLMVSLFEEGEGIAIRIMANLIPTSLEQLYNDLINKGEHNFNDFVECLVQNNSKSNINQKGEIYMTNVYDFYGCFEEGNVIHIRNAVLFHIDKENFTKIEENTITLSNDFYELIENKSKVYNEKSATSDTFCIFYNKKLNKSIVIKFDKEHKSIGKFIPEDAVHEEINEMCTRIVELQDEIIIAYEAAAEKIYIMDLIVEQQVYESNNDFEKQLLETQAKESKKKINRYEALVNLNEKVKKDNTQIVGLDNELEKLMKSLLRIKKPNALITGEAGVGKTALVEKFACMINQGKVPSMFKSSVIVSLNIAEAVAGTKYRGEFEQKLNEIIKFLEKNKNIIVFIDEFHTVIGAGGAEGAIDAANIFKPALARGNIRMIGATTNKEYDEFIKQDGAFIRRFNRIDVLEPTKEDTLTILKGIRPSVETKYGIIVTDKKLEELYNLSSHGEGRMPDLALDALEDYCIEKYYEIEQDKLLLEQQKEEKTTNEKKKKVKNAQS